MWRNGTYREPASCNILLTSHPQEEGDMIVHVQSSWREGDQETRNREREGGRDGEIITNGGMHIVPTCAAYGREGKGKCGRDGGRQDGMEEGELSCWCCTKGRSVCRPGLEESRDLHLVNSTANFFIFSARLFVSLCDGSKWWLWCQLLIFLWLIFIFLSFHISKSELTIIFELLCLSLQTRLFSGSFFNAYW